MSDCPGVLKDLMVVTTSRGLVSKEVDLLVAKTLDILKTEGLVPAWRCNVMEDSIVWIRRRNRVRARARGVRSRRGRSRIGRCRRGRSRSCRSRRFRSSSSRTI